MKLGKKLEVLIKFWDDKALSSCSVIFNDLAAIWVAPGITLDNPSIASLSIKPLIVISLISSYIPFKSSVASEKALAALLRLLDMGSIIPSNGVFFKVWYSSV